MGSLAHLEIILKPWPGRREMCMRPGCIFTAMGNDHKTSRDFQPLEDQAECHTLALFWARKTAMGNGCVVVVQLEGSDYPESLSKPTSLILEGAPVMYVEERPDDFACLLR